MLIHFAQNQKGKKKSSNEEQELCFRSFNPFYTEIMQYCCQEFSSVNSSELAAELITEPNSLR